MQIFLLHECIHLGTNILCNVYCYTHIVLFLYRIQYVDFDPLVALEYGEVLRPGPDLVGCLSKGPRLQCRLDVMRLT